MSGLHNQIRREDKNQSIVRISPLPSKKLRTIDLAVDIVYYSHSDMAVSLSLYLG
jgi:hypothetical protein